MFLTAMRVSGYGQLESEEYDTVFRPCIEYSVSVCIAYTKETTLRTAREATRSVRQATSALKFL